jgi:alpha-2-macroglobulin-like protein
MSTRVIRYVTAVSLLILAGTVVWRATAEPAPEKPAPLTLTETLGGSDRYLTYLSTDKPLYRPGETLLVRGVILHHATRKPLDQEGQQSAVIEIKGPKGDTVASGRSTSEESVLGFSWPIPATQAGGEYTVHVSYPFSGQPPSERKFDVRAYRAPRLKSQIKFLRDGYGPEDEVVATLYTERAEGGIPAGSEVTITARVDGEEVFRGSAKVDDAGNCQARFRLPAEMKRGEGTLVMGIEDGGVLETASKTIPILLQTVDLTLYPEGGDLIAGLANRVYFEAFTPAKKPADLAGIVVDGGGNQVAEFRSEHEGRGRFNFTPEKGGKYTLKITEPAGIRSEYPLPEVKPSGVVISSVDEAVAKGGKAKFTLAATSGGKYRVTLRIRDEEMASQTVTLAAHEPKEIALAPKLGAGVLVATVWDEQERPLAERLVFRHPEKSVQVKLTADSPQYVPGGNVKIKVQTLDDAGKPASAVVGLSATDDSVLEMIDKREQAPRLPVMVLLEGDVQELADAHVYLDPENEKAPLAVDLLLGTQGWRRFAMVDITKFTAEHGDLARRMLALRIVTRREGDKLEKLAAVDLFRFAAPRAAVPPPAPVQAEAFDNFAEAAPEPQAEPEPPQDRPVQGEKVAERPAGGERQAAGPPGLIADREPRSLPPLEQKQERADLEEALEQNAARRKRIAKDEAPHIGNDLPTVRVYAHQVRPDHTPGDRRDFTETIYWHAGLRTNEKGEATIEFGLNDSVTSFRVFADAFSDGGGLGNSSLQIDSVEPFYLEPKLPLEVTMGDVIRAPIGIVNATNASLNGQFAVKGPEGLPITIADDKFALGAGDRIRRMMNLNVGKQLGEMEFTLSAEAGPYADQVTRKLLVRPLGFPTQSAFGGLISPDGMAIHEVSIPDTLIPGSLESRIVVHPTPLASLSESLEGLIREPYGCFEQTSSTIYPLVMAQQYFMSHQGVDPALVEKSGQILTTGYERLLGFESKSGGFEWFGGDPGHDALTAYGLLEFTDMSQVRHVDPAMLDRTRTWLLAQRDGKGGYVRKRPTLHTWIEDPECANAYNTWALLEAGVKDDLSTEVKWVRSAAETTQNTYAIALGANVLALAGDKEGENHLLDKLAGLQQDDGSLRGATTSVVGSGGEALTIETTALAVLAWLKNPSYTSNVEKSIKYLAEACKGGRYGSTQSTVLALRAIVAYDKSRAKPTTPGSLQLVVDGREIGEAVAFDQDTTGAIELPVIAEMLTPGKHRVEVRMNKGSRMPYSIAVNYHSLKPTSSEDCKLHLQVKLRDGRVEEGNVTEADVVVVNRTNEAIPTPMAIVGIPGGLEVRHDQLKELVKQGKIDAYEVLGREVVLYWRSLDKEARVELPLSLLAAVPGRYTGPASRAYLYYTDEHKQWVDGLAVEIAPKVE